MKEILFTILGIDPGEIPAEAETQLIWANDPGSWKTFALFAVFGLLIYGVFWLYRREMKTCPRKVRITLAFLRAAALIVLAVILLKPVLAVSERRTLESTIVVAVDDSFSMGTEDQYVQDGTRPQLMEVMQQEGRVPAGESMRRIDLVNYLFARGGDELREELSQHGRVVVRTFSGVQDFVDVPSRMTRMNELEQEQAAQGAATRTPLWIRLLVIISAFVVLAGAVVTLVGLGIRAKTLWLSSAAVTAVFIAAGAVGVKLWLNDASSRRQSMLTVVDQDLPESSGRQAPTFELRGNSTNLDLAISESFRQRSDGPLAAIVLVTDGQNNEGKDPREIAEKCGQAETPVYVIGVGDPNEPANVRVNKVFARDSVWKNDPFEIKAHVTAEGLGDADLTVVLEKREKGSDIAQTVARKNVTVSAGRPFAQVSFTDETKQAGTYVYTVKAAALQELKENESDNKDTATVRVLDEEARVLLLAGSPSFHYRNLRRLLERERSVILSCWLQSVEPFVKQDGTYRKDEKGKIIDGRIDELPQTFEDQEYFDPEDRKQKTRPGLNRFDVIIMLDPDPEPTLNPREFSETWNDALKEFVQRGGGLFYAAGPKYTADFLTSPRTSSIADLLPVVIENPTTRERRNITRSFRKPWRAKLTAGAYQHPMMRFMDDPMRNRDVWERLVRPQVYWSFPADRVKPGFLMLMEHENPSAAGVVNRGPMGQAALLATGQERAGRTVFMGFDSTWRWRSVGRDNEYFDKFWIQSVRYLVEGKFIGQQKRGEIRIEEPTYDIGSSIPVTARLTKKDFSPMETPEVEATLVVTDGGMLRRTTPVTMKLVQDAGDGEAEAGTYQAMIKAEQKGRHELRLRLDGDREQVEIKAGFDVVIPQRETSTVRLDRTRLEEIAKVSGGRYYSVDSAEKLADDIAHQPEKITSDGRPQELWDTPLVLALMVMLLTVEWGVRKFHKLL